MSPTDRLIEATLAATRCFTAQEIKASLEQMTIIVSAPRSGSNLLFELMTGVKDVWTVGGESHGIYRVFPHLRAENTRFDSGSLNAAHADRDTRHLLRAIFLFMLRDSDGKPYIMLPPDQRPATISVLEKTPRNALNIPFLLRVFPNAKFVFLHRDPRATIASLVEAWKVGLQSGRFVTFRELPGWDRAAWCFLLPPDWQSMIAKSLPEIAAFQWSVSNDIILDQLALLPADRWTTVSYESLVSNPGSVRAKLCEFMSPDLSAVGAAIGALPLSRTTLTPPHPDKWKKYQREIEALLPSLDKLQRRIAEVCQSRSSLT